MYWGIFLTLPNFGVIAFDCPPRSVLPTEPPPVVLATTAGMDARTMSQTDDRVLRRIVRCPFLACGTPADSFAGPKRCPRPQIMMIDLSGGHQSLSPMGSRSPFLGDGNDAVTRNPGLPCHRLRWPISSPDLAAEDSYRKRDLFR